jgi:indole-3-acetate monooxygenase
LRRAWKCRARDTESPERRKAGEWHPLFHVIATIAFPLIYAVYLGVAESARTWIRS